MTKVRILLFLILSTTGLHCFGWGPTGHRVTGWVAKKYLNKKADQRLQKLLKGKSLAILATWMDEVRSDSSYQFMDDWHWVTIPHGQTYEQTQKNPNGDLIQTLERIIAELKTHQLPEAAEIERLKILIHLVGDIHQPLHVGARDDRGGNEVKVTWFKNESNLHRVWDSDMIDDSRLSFTELAESLDHPVEAQLTEWQRSIVRDWANESQSYETEVYNIGNGKLGYQYTYENFDLVRLRLLQAGVRLAGILNEIYGK